VQSFQPHHLLLLLMMMIPVMVAGLMLLLLLQGSTYPLRTQLPALSPQLLT
jgi:hypothetical protein